MPSVSLSSDEATSKQTLSTYPASSTSAAPPFASAPAHTYRQSQHYTGALFFVLGVCIILIGVTIYTWIKRYTRSRRQVGVRDDAGSVASHTDSDTSGMAKLSLKEALSPEVSHTHVAPKLSANGEGKDARL
ncbi:hypothetical protein BD626DRAFT_630277 [Schizophyllum amplum]|uniref:Uncharacterized protein n=1 Tax=Schizophyllum amplum TaxID=97359 RepID=A0A550CE98_9AGAR|nr:hypothetical protein BD626DRAFT_529301 [Auriculariopsis ampla]TRM63125.1 hypothetical protein BD626DRAFT_630277 [Auriculariopsis ampla]